MSRKTFSFWFVAVPDALLMYAALFLAIEIRYPDGLDKAASDAHISAFTVLHGVWILVLFIHGLYDAGTFRRYTSLLFNLLSAMLVNLLLAVIYFYTQPTPLLRPGRFLLIDVGLVFILLLSWHLIVKYFLKNNLRENLYIFSSSNEMQDLEDEIGRHNFLGYRVLGRLSEQTVGTVALEKNSSVIVMDSLHTSPAISAALYKLRTLGTKFYNHKDFYEQLLRRVYLSDLNELWFLENINYQEKRLYNIVKRIVDVLFGFFAFLVFVVTYPLFAALIKLETPGPVLFVQDRVGKNGKVFKIYKYRTMFGGRTDTWTEKNDPRITKLGNILRKTRLDELPQAINLISGDISLVGPRPEQVGIVETLRKEIPFYDERHLVKPGLTGWAQLNIYAGSLEETKTKLQYDLYYIKHRSFLFDLEIVLKTIYYIFAWKGR